ISDTQRPLSANLSPFRTNDENCHFINQDKRFCDHRSRWNHRVSSTDIHRVVPAHKE
ncbi:hypothetical protein HHI36_006461, partial [Cryptolaemus montrouzieri]